MTKSYKAIRLIGVPLEAGPVFLMAFIIGVKSYMRVTPVTLDIYMYMISGQADQFWQPKVVRANFSVTGPRSAVSSPIGTSPQNRPDANA